MEPFYAKGNIFIVLVYAAFMLLFLYIYGGFKIGYIKRGNLIYSQALSGLCANVIMYLQIVLLYRRLPDVRPLLAMTLADLIVIGICSYFFDKLFSYIFPPRDILLIYGEYPVENWVEKLQQEKINSVLKSGFLWMKILKPFRKKFWNMKMVVYS